ncbi:glycosyl transferase, putative [Babesia ovata]|uniref:Glycosyl transferase, putative n=1 Tax=Babesia ovata TaxID=189622 RepID=A0A2H6KIU1_9APIC|nr:glycosyl transferase, putative [Babesia ovata]GBE62915.1 glycosyl transferase, putative [Babesia ovata]
MPPQPIEMFTPTRQTGHENLRQLLAVLSQFAFVVWHSGIVRIKQRTVKLSTTVRAHICVAELLGQGADSVLERLQDGTGGVSEFGGGEFFGDVGSLFDQIGHLITEMVFFYHFLE